LLKIVGTKVLVTLLESSSIFNDYKAIIPYDTHKPDIKRYVSELDPKLAIVFNIIYFRCYSYKEAADLLKASNWYG